MEAGLNIRNNVGKEFGAGEMPQRSRVLAALSENLGLVPRTHARPFVTTWNFRCHGSDSLL